MKAGWGKKKQNTVAAGRCVDSVPEISVLGAEVFVHGVQGAHATVFLQPDPVRKKIFTRSFAGGSQQRTHHHCAHAHTHIKMFYTKQFLMQIYLEATIWSVKIQLCVE